MKKTIFLVPVIILFTVILKAQSRAQDSLAIIKTSLDYIDGYYTNNAERMQRALHPELSKKVIFKNAKGNEQLLQEGALTLVNDTKSHEFTPMDQRRQDVFVTDIFRDAATVKIIATDWVDYLQLHKWHGHWVIVNVLWEQTK